MKTASSRPHCPSSLQVGLDWTTTFSSRHARHIKDLGYCKADINTNLQLGWVESLSNQEEVELRAKIQALGLEVTKVPPKPHKELGELEIAAELDKLSAKLDDVDKMISSAMAEDPQVQSLLSSTSDVWMPVITATADQRRGFASTSDEGCGEEEPKDLQSN